MVCDGGGRNLLLADVVPFLQQAGRKHKCEVQMVEMRWGIQTQTPEPQTFIPKLQTIKPKPQTPNPEPLDCFCEMFGKICNLIIKIRDFSNDVHQIDPLQLIQDDAARYGPHEHYEIIRCYHRW